jgi:dihydropteroate synthase
LQTHVSFDILVQFLIVNAVVEQQFVYRFGRRQYNLSSRTHLMGILNVTPDSFSDGGRFLSCEAAVERALQMVEEGADIIDVGGESTRPRSQSYGEGAEGVSVDEELRRVIPVIDQIVKHADVPVSIDTYKSQVAREALSAGASIVNDISGFTFDPMMSSVVGQANATAVIMHIQGAPQTMQENPSYDDLIGEVSAFLKKGLEKGRQAGIAQMLIDPGIGFGKRLEHNLQLIGQLKGFNSLGFPILVGPSRKSFIGAILNASVAERLDGSLAAAVACILNGAHVLRVHDVKETRRVALVADAIKQTMIEPT